MREVAIGIVLGLAGAYWLTQWMTTMLFNVPPRDPVTYAGVALLLTAVGRWPVTFPRAAPRVSIR